MAKFIDLKEPSKQLEFIDHPSSTALDLGEHAHHATRLAEFFDLDGQPSHTDNHPGSPADHKYTEAELRLRKLMQGGSALD